MNSVGDTREGWVWRTGKSAGGSWWRRESSIVPRE